MLERLDVQRIKSIVRWAPALRPFLHFTWAQIVWRIDIAWRPFSGLESLQDSALILMFHILRDLTSMRSSRSTLRECFRSYVNTLLSN
jgi:hypothetical protein